MNYWNNIRHVPLYEGLGKCFFQRSHGKWFDFTHPSKCLLLNFHKIQGSSIWITYFCHIFRWQNWALFLFCDFFYGNFHVSPPFGEIFWIFLQPHQANKSKLCMWLVSRMIRQFSTPISWGKSSSLTNTLPPTTDNHGSGKRPPWRSHLPGPHFPLAWSWQKRWYFWKNGLFQPQQSTTQPSLRLKKPLPRLQNCLYQLKVGLKLQVTHWFSAICRGEITPCLRIGSGPTVYSKKPSKSRLAGLDQTLRNR